MVSPVTSESFSSETASPQGCPLSREDLLAFMRVHSLKGSKMLKTRTATIGSSKIVHSPDDPDITFAIRRVGVPEVIAYRNRNSKVTYTTRNGENGDEYLTEKEFPQGTGQLETLLLCLEDWDIANESGEKRPITEENIQRYLNPREFDYLFDQCHEVNPILQGTAAQKKS